MVRRQGFGIIEAVVAMAILLVVLAAIVPVFLHYLKTNTATEIRSQAMAVAQEVLEELRLRDPRTLPTSGTTTQDRIRDGRTFTVVVNYCAEASLCFGNARHLTLEVRYEGKKVYALETVYTALR